MLPRKPIVVIHKNSGLKCQSAFCLLGGLLQCALLALTVAARPSPTLAERIQEIVRRPEFRHALFGIEFYSLDAEKPVFTLNADKLFTPASTTKLLTEGTALELLGPDYRFHTRVYRAGPIESDGTLQGDLVLVASGDPNLSGRIQADGKLAFEKQDHSYGGSPDTRAVPGDPLLVIRQLAREVAHRVKRIDGRVLVDCSLFPEGAPELGTGVTISPVAVSDNVIDVTAAPGAALGAPVGLRISPETSYVRFINNATMGPAESKPELKWEKYTANPDGTHTVTISGNMPFGKPSILFAYPVPQPSKFAQTTLVEALRQEAVSLSIHADPEPPDFKALSVAYYKPENLVAEHVSPPLSEELKVTLKVSQNLHASMMPYILGAVLAHKTEDIEQAGFDLEREFLQKAGLDLGGASQGDGAGAALSAFYTPDFMVHYLAYMARQKDFPIFFYALPILGRDGTLWNIQPQSPAAGQVHAKTGTFTAYDALNREVMVTGKGLAGYVTTADGRRLAFAVYANHVSVPMDSEAATKIVGQALGEIAAAAYLTPAEPTEGTDR